MWDSTVILHGGQVRRLNGIRLHEHSTMKTDELREKYLAFFETKGCVRRPATCGARWTPRCCSPCGHDQFKDHFWAAASWSSPGPRPVRNVSARATSTTWPHRLSPHVLEMLGNFTLATILSGTINWRGSSDQLRSGWLRKKTLSTI